MIILQIIAACVIWWMLWFVFITWLGLTNNKLPSQLWKAMLIFIPGGPINWAVLIYFGWISPIREKLQAWFKKWMES